MLSKVYHGLHNYFGLEEGSGDAALYFFTTGFMSVVIFFQILFRFVDGY
ncbi:MULTISPECIES: hypothetical protein [unclassified Exiguobacterium]|nr:MULTISPECIES: hypothetical protein [unclassified Exiguobacterium]